MLRAWYSLRLIGRISCLNLRAQLEYRADFWLRIAFGVAWQTSIVVFAAVILGRFPTMGGWSAEAVLLVAALRMFSHGLFELFFGRTVDLAVTVQEGKIDAYLLRPMPVYRQVQLTEFPANAFGDLLVGVSLLWWALWRVHMSWTPMRVTYLITALIGGTLMEAAVFTALSSLHLHFPSAMGWTVWVEEIMGTFGNYPLKILPAGVSGTLTFLLPLAFIAYLPVAVLTGHMSGLGVPSLLAAAAPAVGAASYVGSRILWNASLRRYRGVNG
jgi:ABC-2 type transport system permease protein